MQKNDVIYRQAAIDCVTYDEEYTIECLKALPSAQPERPKGKWLSQYEYCKKHGCLPSGVVALRWCDQCEQGVVHPTDFCPHCGADMRGDQNE